MKRLGSFAVAVAALLSVSFGGGVREDAHSTLVSMAAAQEERDAPAVPVPDVDIDIEREGTTAWIVDPTILIAAGVILLIIVLIAFASRGGGTTIIRER